MTRCSSPAQLRLLLPLLVLAELLCTARVRAEEPAERTPAAGVDARTRAAELDRLAREAFGRGEFARAAELFASAYEALPHAATLYNQALALEQAGERARAANALQAAVRDPALAAELKNDGQKRLSALRHELGELVLSSSAPARVDIGAVRDQPTPLTTHLEPGRYSVRIRFDSGAARTRDVELAAGEVLQLEVEPPLEAAPRATPQPTPQAAPGGSTHKTLGWLSLGVGAAAATSAVVLGISTLEALDDFERSGNTDADARERAVNLRTFTNVAAGAAVAFGGVGLYLLLFQDESASAQSAAAVVIGARNVTLRTAF